MLLVGVTLLCLAGGSATTTATSPVVAEAAGGPTIEIPATASPRQSWGAPPTWTVQKKSSFVQARPTTPPMSPEEALSWMLNPTPAPVPSPWDRNDAFRALGELAPEERSKAYLEVLVRGRDEVASSAAAQLIKDRLGDPTQVAKVIVSRGLRISEAAVGALVGQPRIAPGLLSVPRRVLEDALASEKPIELEHSRLTKGEKQIVLDAFSSGKSVELMPPASTVPEMAALVLAEHGTVADAELVRRAVRAQPASRTLWFAVAASGGAAGPDAALARGVYRDTSRPGWLRIGAAAAVANTDVGAASFVTGRIHDVLAKFGDKDESASLMTAPGMKEAVDNARQHDRDFDPRVMLLAGQVRLEFAPLTALRFLSVPQAKDLAGRLLGSVNPWCHSAAALASALRWPELLLAGRPAHLTEKDYAQALAVLVLRYPERKAEVERAFGEPLPREALEEAAVYWPSGAGARLVRGW